MGRGRVLLHKASLGRILCHRRKLVEKLKALVVADRREAPGVPMGTICSPSAMDLLL